MGALRFTDLDIPEVTLRTWPGRVGRFVWVVVNDDRDLPQADKTREFLLDAPAAVVLRDWLTLWLDETGGEEDLS